MTARLGTSSDGTVLTAAASRGSPVTLTRDIPRSAWTAGENSRACTANSWTGTVDTMSESRRRGDGRYVGRDLERRDERGRAAWTIWGPYYPNRWDAGEDVPYCKSGSYGTRARAREALRELRSWERICLLIHGRSGE